MLQPSDTGSTELEDFKRALAMGGQHARSFSSGASYSEKTRSGDIKSGDTSNANFSGASALQLPLRVLVAVSTARRSNIVSSGMILCMQILKLSWSESQGRFVHFTLAHQTHTAPPPFLLPPPSLNMEIKTPPSNMPMSVSKTAGFHMAAQLPDPALLLHYLPLLNQHP